MRLPDILAAESENRAVRVLSYILAVFLILAIMAWTNGWFDSDPDPPSAPSGLVLTAADGAIEVSWTAPAGTDTDGFGYQVGWKFADDEWGGVSDQSALVNGHRCRTRSPD